MLAVLSGFFALVGLVLAAVGLYGVLSYSVVQRTREIGIRVALGARQLRVMRTVLADVGAATLVGIACGLAGALYLSRFVQTLLFEVTRSTSGASQCRSEPCSRRARWLPTRRCGRRGWIPSTRFAMNEREEHHHDHADRSCDWLCLSVGPCSTMLLSLLAQSPGGKP